MEVPRLHVVTDDAVLARIDFLEVARTVLEAGGESLALHVRGPTSGGRVVYELVRALLARDRSHALVCVNDRVDVALATGAAGVHLGQRSLSIPDARVLVGPTTSIGVSVHDAREAAEASRDGADYVFLGTLYPTPSHGETAGGGLAWVTQTTRVAHGLPLVGIGGVTPQRVRAVLRAGGHGVAVIRGVWSAMDPARAVREYLSALDLEEPSEGDST